MECQVEASLCFAFFFGVVQNIAWLPVEHVTFLWFVVKKCFSRHEETTTTKKKTAGDGDPRLHACMYTRIDRSADTFDILPASSSQGFVSSSSLSKHKKKPVSSFWWLPLLLRVAADVVVLDCIKFCKQIQKFRFFLVFSKRFLPSLDTFLHCLHHHK